MRRRAGDGVAKARNGPARAARGQCRRDVARQDARLRPLALGLLAGLVALHVYGLTDALAPGSKPALIFWCALGVLAALEKIDRTQINADER